MSKSLGNLITIKEALDRYGADALRIFVLSSHYRSPLTYSAEVLEAAKGGIERLITVISRDDPNEGKGESLDTEPYRKQLIEAMDDDFNTPQAIATLFDLAKAINQAGDSGLGFQNAKGTLLSLGREILGLKLPKRIIRVISERISIKETIDATIPITVNARVNRLAEERVKCRKERNWQRADEIRKKLAELGVILEDTKARTEVTYKHVPSEESLDRLLTEFGLTLSDKI